jgi:hypothetical protein
VFFQDSFQDPCHPTNFVGISIDSASKLFPMVDLKLRGLPKIGTLLRLLEMEPLLEMVEFQAPRSKANRFLTLVLVHQISVDCT